jgi:hypothetical protein
MHQHRHGLAAPKSGIRKLQRHGALPAPRATSQKMQPTVSYTGEPIVEKRNATIHDANRSSPACLASHHAAGTMVDDEKRAS